MRLSAPELAARYREGMLSAGANVLDAGMVGSEMLYWLVGARELDGGLMCTASHNPKAYTGAKLVREGAIALSGDSGIQDVRRLVEDGGAGGQAEPSERGELEEEDIYGPFQEAALRFIDADAVRSAARPLKVVVDGGNGMAGPMVGPLLESLGLELIETYWRPDGEFPDHEPNPLLPKNRSFIIEKVRESGADLGIAWDGDADRCFFIDETGRFVDGDFLTALLAESLLSKAEKPGEAILYDVRASRAVADTVARAGGVAYVNRVGHAFFKTRMHKEGSLFGGRGLRPLLLPRLLLRGLGDDPRPARAGDARDGRPEHVRAARALPRELLHLRRDQLRGLRPAGEDGRARRALLRRRAETPRRDLDRLRGLALQRAALQHRAPAAPVPGVARVASRTWNAAATRCWP